MTLGVHPRGKRWLSRLRPIPTRWGWGVLSLWVILGLSIVAWSTLDCRPPGWDQSGHLTASVVYSRAMAAGPVAFRPPGIRFLGILSRRGLVPLLRSAYPSLMGSDPDGVSTFRACEMRPGWAPPLPRGQRCSHDQRVNSGRRLPPLPAARPYHPSVRPVVPGSALRGVTGVYLRSPVRSSPRPVAPRTERGPLGFSLELRTPSRQGPVGRTSRWGLTSNTDQELRLRHRRPPLREFTRNTRLRVALTRHRYATR